MILLEEIDRTLFSKQFLTLKNELNPLVLDVLNKNDIGDNVALFYFASLIKETLREMDDKQMSEAVITFIFDEGRK